MTGRDAVDPDTREAVDYMLHVCRTSDGKRRALKLAMKAGYTAGEALARLSAEGELLNAWQGVATEPRADIAPPPWPAWLADQRDPERSVQVARLCDAAFVRPGEHSVESARAALRESIEGLERSIENARANLAWDETQLALKLAALAKAEG